MVAPGKARFYPSGLMLQLVRVFIRLYQCTLSPLLSLVAGGGSGCRFQPTCSAYFLEAVESHGFLHGSWLGLKRIGRCQPWGGYGHDPVPSRLRSGPEDRFVCE
jgi:putative membrane protein insertion efficiency factor